MEKGKTDIYDSLGKTLAALTIPVVIILFIIGLIVMMLVVPPKNGIANAASEPQEFTVGNSTFVPIPVGFSAEPSQKKLEMEAVQKFEKAHPELVVLCWQPNYLVGGMNVAVDGVFIYHKLK